MINYNKQRAIKGKNKGGDDDDDDDNDDDDDDKCYRKIEARKTEYKDENNLDPSVDEEFNEIVRYSENLQGKIYITRKYGSIYANTFNNDYEKIISDYFNKKNKVRGHRR